LRKEQEDEQSRKEKESEKEYERVKLANPREYERRIADNPREYERRLAAAKTNQDMIYKSILNKSRIPTIGISQKRFDNVVTTNKKVGRDHHRKLLGSNYQRVHQISDKNDYVSELRQRFKGNNQGKPVEHRKPGKKCVIDIDPLSLGTVQPNRTEEIDNLFCPTLTK
jgi:Tfp pilus assembly protein PilP